jgi:hypothetical protein
MIISRFMRALRGADRPQSPGQLAEPAANKEACASRATQQKVSQQKPLQQAYLPILGTWCMTAAATNPADFRQALALRQCRPGPDAELRSPSGAPLLTGRVPALDTCAAGAFLARAHPGCSQDACTMAGDHASEQKYAGLVRLLALLGRLFDALEADWPLALEAGGAPSPRPYAMPRLDVTLLLPAWLASDAITAAGTWLALRAAALPVRTQAVQDGVRAEVNADVCADVCTINDADVPAVTNSLLDRLTQSAPDMLLLLACDSMLWHLDMKTSPPDAGALQAPSSPGEGAFGILLAGAGISVLPGRAQGYLAHPAPIEWPTPADAAASAAMENRIAAPVMQHVQATAAPRCGLSGVIAQASARAGMADHACGSIASDAGPCRSRILPLAAALAEYLPGLDPVHDHLDIAEACGTLGIASLAGTIVAATAQATVSGRPAMAIALGRAARPAAFAVLPVRPATGGIRPTAQASPPSSQTMYPATPSTGAAT